MAVVAAILGPGAQQTSDPTYLVDMHPCNICAASKTEAWNNVPACSRCSKARHGLFIGQGIHTACLLTIAKDEPIYRELATLEGQPRLETGLPGPHLVNRGEAFKCWCSNTGTRLWWPLGGHRDPANHKILEKVHHIACLFFPHWGTVDSLRAFHSWFLASPGAEPGEGGELAHCVHVIYKV